MESKRNDALSLECPPVGQSIYVVDDDHAMREALSMLLRSVNLTVRPCASAAEFFACIGPEDRGCALVDVRMPQISGFELFDIMRRRGITIPLIFISAHGSVSGAVHAIKAGALDFIEKPFDDQQLLNCVYRAIDRDQQAVRRRNSLKGVQENWERLTAREREVMRMIADSMLSRQIAARLNISVRTVENHRANLLQKMNAQSVADIVRMQFLIDPAALERDSKPPADERPLRAVR